jgi:hypothetical protein
LINQLKEFVMKKTLCAVALSAVLLSACFAIAENAGPKAGPPDGKPDFATMKAGIQEMLTDKIARDQKTLACVKAAQTIDALEACRPQRKDMRRPR